MVYSHVRHLVSADVMTCWQHAVGAMGGGQQLSSPGSCLPAFRTNPYIECTGSGQCHFFNEQYSFWLVTTSPQFNHDVSGVTLKAGALETRISRCTVCELAGA